MATITTGRTVLYVLSKYDVEYINRLRAAGRNHQLAGGAQKHVGNVHHEGDVVPLIVVRVWPDEYGSNSGVNGQAILDGNDSLWVTSAREGTEPGNWHWPKIEPKDVLEAAKIFARPVSEDSLAATA